MDSNLFWCITGIIGGSITSFIISLYFFKKSSNVKRIIYSKTCFYTNALFSKSFKNKTLLAIANYIYKIPVWKYKKYHKYYLDHYRFKVESKGLIQMRDFVESSPLRIEVSNNFYPPVSSCNVLVTTTNYDSNIKLKFNENTIFINYDYFSKEDTISITILYNTGATTVKGVLERGKIVNVGSTFIPYIIASLFMNILLSILIGLLILIIFIILYHIEDTLNLLLNEVLT